MTRDDPAAAPLPVGTQVALAVRAHRRRLGMSQRRYAAYVGLTKTTLARIEAHPETMRLSVLTEALEHTGFGLSVRSIAHDTVPDWEQTDLAARTRGGARFPAHLPVKPCEHGPAWWFLDEVLRPRRRLGPQPLWTTEDPGRSRSILPPTFTYGRQRPRTSHEPGPP